MSSSPPPLASFPLSRKREHPPPSLTLTPTKEAEAPLRQVYRILRDSTSRLEAYHSMLLNAELAQRMKKQRTLDRLTELVTTEEGRSNPFLAQHSVDILLEEFVCDSEIIRAFRANEAESTRRLFLQQEEPLHSPLSSPLR